MEDFKNSIDSSHPKEISEYLEKLVADRNELVHSFLKKPFSNDFGEINETAVEEYLNNKHSFALPIFEFLDDLLTDIRNIKN